MNDEDVEERDEEEGDVEKRKKEAEGSTSIRKRARDKTLLHCDLRPLLR